MTAAASSWQAAFEAIRQSSEFAVLNDLLNTSGSCDGINASLEWDGLFLTPLFIASLLHLEDQLPRLLALGADAGEQCLFEGFLCGPIHAAALRGDVDVLRALLDAGCDAQSLAEMSSMASASSAHLRSGQKAAMALGLTKCNALHVLLASDLFSEDVYRLLLERGVRLSASCQAAVGEALPGLLLPKRLNNRVATEESLDSVLGDEIKSIIRESRGNAELSAFLEMGATLKADHGISAYRFTKDVDFTLGGASAASTGLVGDKEVPTAFIYAVEVGNCEAARLLLYAGADGTRAVQRVLSLGDRLLTTQLQAIQTAVLRADSEWIQQLIAYSMDPGTICRGSVCCTGSTEALESWDGLGLVHMAVIGGHPDLIPTLLKCRCDINARAYRTAAAREGSEGGIPGSEAITSLKLAVILGDAHSTAKLLDCEAAVDEETRALAHRTEAVCEMFGGDPVVGLDQWVSALLSGETAVQQLLDRRTDLSRVLDWPEDVLVETLLGRHRLAGNDLLERLAKTLGEVPTVLRGVRPVHLACLLQQPWALQMLADAGVQVGNADTCLETPRGETGDGVPLSVVLLSARVGSLQMLECLIEGQFGLHVLDEIPFAPDLTPPFFPWKCGDTADASSQAATWAWEKLGALELSILHRHIDAVVLLVRLGADLLHKVDHVAMCAPSHYSITDACFRGLTPLHLCALLDLPTAAAALLNEGDLDDRVTMQDVHSRPQRQRLLAATCVQAWATVDTGGDPAREPWLWRDLTPLHLAIISKSYGVAEILIEVSTADTLGLLCVSRDASLDAERSFSALLLAYDRDLKDLHRKITRKLPKR